MRVNIRNDRGGGRGGRSAKVEEVLDNTIDYVQCDGLVSISGLSFFRTAPHHFKANGLH